MAMELNLDEIDFRNIGNWHIGLQLAALGILFVVLCGGVGYFAIWSGQLAERDQLRTEEATLKDSFLEKKRKAINLDAYNQQLIQIKLSLSELLKQLPKKSEMDALLIDINQAGVSSGLSFLEFKPASKEILTQEMAELPIKLKIRGSFHDFGRFTGDIAKLSRIVLLNDVKIDPTKEGTLTLETTAKTYRYLDESEIVAPSGKSKKGKKK